MPSLYTDYATPAQVATFMGIDAGDLPADIAIIISRTSEIVNQYIHTTYDDSNDYHVEAAMLATCAQCQYYISVGLDITYGMDGYNSVKIGSLQLQKPSGSGGSGGSDNTVKFLIDNARRYLERVGLLYRGVKLR